MPSLGQTEVCGVYRTNFPTYGMFGKTLTLNYDSSAVMKFQGDLMLDYSIGKWSFENKILTITFDSLAHPRQRYKGQSFYEVKRNRLIEILFSKERYEYLKEQVKIHNKTNKEKIKLPQTYRKFLKKFGGIKTLANFLGKQRKQYFEKIK